MRYLLGPLTLGHHEFIELSREQFAAIKGARDHLFVVLGIEEKFNLMMENFFEFELQLLESTLRFLLFHDFEWTSGANDLHTLNRRLANLLSAARLYVDHTKHDVSTLFGGQGPEIAQLNAAYSQEYDTSLGYRVMEALRNVTQHQALPLHHLSHTGSVFRESPLAIRHTCSARISIAQLQEVADFKASVLTELQAFQVDGLVDVKPLVREYITSMGRVHNHVRSMIQPHMIQWNQAFDGALVQFRQRFGDDAVGAGIVVEDDNGQRGETHHLFDDFIKRVKSLQQRNAGRADLKPRYVSSE